MKTISIFSIALFLFITITACNNTKDGTDSATNGQTGMNNMNMANDTTMMKNMMKDPAMMTMMMEHCEKDTAMCRTMCTSMMKSPKMKAMMMDMMEKDGMMDMKMDEKSQ
ncbi:MAG TPA: hypothetical protein VNI52_07160 [Sphingobacteriaceae bacterium]|nr:hypothetical protein [Sphingobacteriaceae bacterium]